MMNTSILFYKLEDFFPRHSPGQRIITKVSCVTVLWAFVCVTLPTQQRHRVVFALQLFPPEIKPLVTNRL